MTTYDDLKQALRQDDLRGDPWGTAIAALFDVCDTLHFDRDATVPAEWDYRPSLFGPLPEDERSYTGEHLPEASTGDLLRFGDLLNRYCDLLRHAGRDY